MNNAGFRLFTLIFLLSCSYNSYATFSGNDVMYDCGMLMDTDKMKEVADFGKASLCAGYLNGLNDMLLVFNKILDLELYCPPDDGLETGQTVLIVIKWLQENPDQLHESMRSIFISIMKDNFPCPK